MSIGSKACCFSGDRRLRAAAPGSTRALEAARTGDGRALGANMKAQIGRGLDRLELLLGQMAAIEAERDAMLARQVEAEAVQSAQGAPARVQKPMDLNGPGAETVPEAEGAAPVRPEAD